MTNNIKIIILISLLCAHELSYSQNVAQKLGYPKEAKLLIIHADDLGLSHSENRASIKSLESTPVNSGSIMVPCPWFPEVAQYFKNNSNFDIGVHLTLNSEWTSYKWGPVTSKDSVNTIVNKNGFFYDNIPAVVQNGNPEHIRLELKNQVKKALQNKIDVTHLDAHMGTAVSSKEFLKKYLEVGNQFQLPVLLVENDMLKETEIMNLMLEGNQITVDKLYTASPIDFENGMDNFYTKTINKLEPGLNTFLIHLAYDDEEMRAVTIGKRNWGSTWRQADNDFFSSEVCQKLLKENNIILVTWREIRDKIVRSKN
ncbi:polysaccharide deacetylase family protein [Croceitalea rosinachiae]|uniref:Polysaccharide deacetylase family protein n=1 Tax=Croceitalea rosinachiae TaxID=3075596 RepID=A0ABU3ABL7_9FLAO|nr:polysaccharide deacetylase family protein [Croceitalea sp. F388]MDT0607557.1 polysaccharide deacetylase family protein [Croceitalea sp. F388]